jgi:hypothetical protein
MGGMATTVAVIVLIEILSVAAGVAIGRILWSDRPSASAPVPTGAATAAPADAEKAAPESAETRNDLEAVSEQLQSLTHQPTAETPAPAEKPPAQSMLAVKASLDTDINAAYAAINDKYLDEVKRLCDELLDRADRLHETGTNDFELEQLQSQVETSMNNLTLLNLGTSEHDVCKTIESEVNKICAQIDRVKV